MGKRTKQQRREAAIRAAATLAERRRTLRLIEHAQAQLTKMAEVHEMQIKILAAEVKRATGKVWGGTLGGVPVWVDETHDREAFSDGIAWVVTDDSMTRCGDG
jgi:hypothetical protein